MKLFFAAALLFLCSTAQAADTDDSKIKCSQFGTKFATEFKKEYVNAVSMWGNPEFYYSPSLGTCLVYTEIADGEINKEMKDTWYYRRVTDIYTNKVLAYARYFIGKNDPDKKPVMVDLKNVGDAPNLRPEVFAQTKAKLFSQ